MDERPVFYDDARGLGRAEFSRRLVWGGAQVSFGSDAMARGYMTVGSVSSDPRPGLPITAGSDRHRKAGRAPGLDRLDDRDLPRSGSALSVRAERSVVGWALARLLLTRADGHAAWKPGGAFRDRGRRRARVERPRRAGLRALPPGRPGVPARTSPRGAVGRADARGRDLPSYDWRGFRLALRAGAGNVWDRRGDVTLSDLRWGVGAGVARRTRFGPIALEGGIDNEGRGALYVSVGYSPTQR